MACRQTHTSGIWAFVSLFTAVNGNSQCQGKSHDYSTYLRVLMYSAIALACSSFSPAMALLCGGLLPDSPFG